MLRTPRKTADHLNFLVLNKPQGLFLRIGAPPLLKKPSSRITSLGIRIRPKQQPRRPPFGPIMDDDNFILPKAHPERTMQHPRLHRPDPRQGLTGEELSSVDAWG